MRAKKEDDAASEYRIDCMTGLRSSEIIIEPYSDPARRCHRDSLAQWKRFAIARERENAEKIKISHASYLLPTDPSSRPTQGPSRPGLRNYGDSRLEFLLPIKS